MLRLPGGQDQRRRLVRALPPVFRQDPPVRRVLGQVQVLDAAGGKEVRTVDLVEGCEDHVPLAEEADVAELHLNRLVGAVEALFFLPPALKIQVLPAEGRGVVRQVTIEVLLRPGLPPTFDLLEECLALFRKVGDVAGIAWTLNYQGDVARESNNLAAARSFYEQSLAAFSLSRDGWGIASALSDLASLSSDESNNDEARRLYGESIQMFQSLGHKRGIARVLECLAANAAAQSDAVQSLRFAGAAAALRERLGTPLTPTEQPKLEKALEFARRTLGNAAGLTAWMEGWGMPVEQAIQEALDCGPESNLRTGSSG